MTGLLCKLGEKEFVDFLHIVCCMNINYYIQGPLEGWPKIGLREYVAITWLIIPKAGIIKIYTSGCPKNQNKCWYNMGSPPPAGSKKVVLKYRVKSSAHTPDLIRSVFVLTKVLSEPCEIVTYHTAL